MPTSNQIAKDIAKQVGVGAAVCKSIIGAFFERARDHVLAGERVRITGFGAFRPRFRKAGERHNPKSGGKFQVEAATLIAFSQAKPGQPDKEDDGEDAGKSPLDGIA